MLLIPEGNSEPYSFRLSMGTIKFILVLAIVGVLHALLGGFAYYKWFSVAQKNNELIENNVRLLKDNRRIYQIEQQVEDHRRMQERLLNALGVSKSSLQAAYRNFRDTEFDPPESYDLASPDDQMTLEPDRNNKVVSSRPAWRIDKKKPLHKYTPNIPTALPVDKGHITDSFRPQMRSWLFSNQHFGIDIAGQVGSDIKAAGSGIVIFAGWTSVLGNLIIINHGNDIFSFYGHNNRILVSERMQVQKNDPIALLGNSGQSTGPHLHFAIWQNGKPVDPREFILELQTE
ncbi:MAG: M23 family peptidase [Calditrichaeota bacterium]|nr:MAG: M23 family peptidase [Calditrichota bacterium]